MNEGQPKAGCQFRDKIRRGVVGDLIDLKSDESELDGPNELFTMTRVVCPRSLRLYLPSFEPTITAAVRLLLLLTLLPFKAFFSSSSPSSCLTCPPSQTPNRDSSTHTPKMAAPSSPSQVQTLLSSLVTPARARATTFRLAMHPKYSGCASNFFFFFFRKWSTTHHHSGHRIDLPLFSGPTALCSQ